MDVVSLFQRLMDMLLSFCSAPFWGFAVYMAFAVYVFFVLLNFIDGSDKPC